MNTEQFESRKRDHIEHALDGANQAIGLSGLEAVHLIHDALPELDFVDVELSTDCLDRKLKTPFYVSGMTAGHPDAPDLNLRLARGCNRRGWAFGVGSQRRELEGDPKHIDRWSEFRSELPELTVFANLGISQIISVSPSRIRSVLESIRPQALAIHLNALQEVIQPEGTPQFKGAIEAIRRLIAETDIPVVLKETGCGFSRRTLEKISRLGISAIDVSGLGGTHWGRIEGKRSQKVGLLSQVSETFANWGESTVNSVLAASESGLDAEIWASGGVRSGLDSAKLIALGASRVGFAQPALRAALEGGEVLNRWMEQQEYELRVAMFCTGTRTPTELRGNKSVWRPGDI